MHNYTTQKANTQIKKNTNTQIKKYTNTQKIHNYAYKKTKSVIGKTTCWLEGRSNCGGDGWFIMSSPPSCWQYSANNCSHVYVCGSNPKFPERQQFCQKLELKLFCLFFYLVSFCLLWNQFGVEFWGYSALHLTFTKSRKWVLQKISNSWRIYYCLVFFFF